MSATPTPATQDSSFDALLRDVAHMPDVEPEPTYAPGDAITPTLTAVQKLGSGGMGTVWEADDSSLERRVAVKLLQRRAGHYVTQEAAALERIRHPQIVKMHRFGVTDEGRAFIVMELLSGHSLAHHVSTCGPLSPADTAMLLTQCADALGHAHASGLLHRDIKPSNIQLVESDRSVDARLIDFGISREVPWADEKNQHEARSAGTPGYMSPEQRADPSSIDGRSDMWSLAATAHFALTGHRVGESDTTLPPPLSNWLDRALSADPRDRFRTPREMAAAFRDAHKEVENPLAKLLDAAVREPASERARPVFDTRGRDHMRLAVLGLALLAWLLWRFL